MSRFVNRSKLVQHTDNIFDDILATYLTPKQLAKLNKANKREKSRRKAIRAKAVQNHLDGGRDTLFEVNN